MRGFGRYVFDQALCSFHVQSFPNCKLESLSPCRAKKTGEPEVRAAKVVDGKFLRNPRGIPFRRERLEKAVVAYVIFTKYPQEREIGRAHV